MIDDMGKAVCKLLMTLTGSDVISQNIREAVKAAVEGYVKANAPRNC